MDDVSTLVMAMATVYMATMDIISSLQRQPPATPATALRLNLPAAMDKPPSLYSPPHHLRPTLHPSFILGNLAAWRGALSFFNDNGAAGALGARTAAIGSGNGKIAISVGGSSDDANGECPFSSAEHDAHSNPTATSSGALGACTPPHAATFGGRRGATFRASPQRSLNTLASSPGCHAHTQPSKPVCWMRFSDRALAGRLLDRRTIGWHTKPSQAPLSLTYSFLQNELQIYTYLHV